MSFQDVKPSKSTPGQKRGLLQSYAGPTTISESGENDVSSSSSTTPYSALSDNILAYRRHLNLLQKMSTAVGTPDGETAASQTNLRLQSDVVRQLGTKIESQLAEAERSLRSNNSSSSNHTSGDRTEASRSRAAHAKLTRDYRKVEANYKNVCMDIRRRQGLADARRKEALEDEERRKFEGDVDEEARRLQVQLQDERFSEEIMREREAEILSINKGMHTVNEIYKDLATIVGSQQDQVDEVETHMADANDHAEAGLKQVEKANEKADSIMGSQCLVS